MLQEPCPMLTILSISSKDRDVPVLPGGLLGGSASSLQKFELHGVPFPSLPTLLLSAKDLVSLILSDILLSGYISPEVMVVYLAPLPKLKNLHIGFRTATPHPEQILPPPTTPLTVLRSLQKLYFSGYCEYLEDFVAQIDAPHLHLITINYFDQDIDIEVPQLSTFFNRSEGLKQTLSPKCKAELHEGVLEFRVIGSAGWWNADDGISICVDCEFMDRQISQLSHVLSWISPSILSDVVHFFLYSHAYVDWDSEDPEPEDLDNVDWLQLLRPFSSMQTLLVDGYLTYRVCEALDDIAGAMVTEVMPALDLLHIGNEPMSCVRRFITVRQASGRPVTAIDDWWGF
jgi:hypothetical protein